MDRHLAIASGDVPCAATTVQTWIVWNANGVATRQVLQLDKSYGADGMVVRKDVARLVHKDVARSLKYARIWGTSGFDPVPV